MTNSELQKKIDQLEVELSEAKKEIATLRKRVDDGGGMFKPEYGEEYWYISAEGTTFVDNWGGDTIECDQYAIGNCFPTEQAAEDTVRTLKLIQKARESQDGFVPDWKDWTQNKYFAYFESGEIRIRRHITRNAASLFGYWEGESACEKFVDENSDELRWFFTEYRL